MCSMADMYEPKDHPQKRQIEKRAHEKLPKEESISALENFCRDEEYVLQTGNAVKEIDAASVKITILHTKSESMLVKVEEDSRKPWYFTHV